MDADEIRSWLRNPEIPSGDVRVLERDGRILGYADITVDDVVHLDVAAPGSWDVLFAWAEGRAQELGVPRVRVLFPSGHELQRVAERRGYEYWRSVCRMEISLSALPEAAALPNGFALGTYAAEDGKELCCALNEAFACDPFWRELTPEIFRAFYLEARGFDPQLWLLARDGRELAGCALAYGQHSGDQTLGWIGTLGVRPRWRRRGLGRALLRAAFRELYDRGVRRVGLGVDAENPTGALRLYERDGMREIVRSENWVREL